MGNKGTNSNQEIVEELFRRYYKILCAYAYRLVNDKHVAEDIVQEVFYELWKKQEQLSFDTTIKYYLFRSIYTRSLNHLSSKNVMNLEYLKRSPEQKIQEIYVQSHSLDQENELSVKELQEKIDKTINSLPEQCRKVFILSRKYELKNKEISEHLGISIKSVEKHISKALSILRSNLKYLGIILTFLF